MAVDSSANDSPTLKRYLSPLAVWALALGSAVGWGAFVMPGTTFLPLAGVWGTVWGIGLGMVIMLIVAVNYHFLMNCYPGSGGTFTYSAKSFGYDHGFLAAWFLLLTYIAIVWANTTALPLISRALLGGFFASGPGYDIAGYHVYLTEFAFTSVVLVLCLMACLRGRLAAIIQTIAAIALCALIVTCFVHTQASPGRLVESFSSASLGLAHPFIGMLNMIALAPWAFAGFENISHSEREFGFSARKSFACLAASLVIGAVLYGLLALLAASTHPAGYQNLAAYIADLGNLSGVESIPTFYSVSSTWGSLGVILLGTAALCGIVTGIIGNSIAASRLLYTMARERLIPQVLGKVNAQGVPSTALLFILALSLPMPLLGRTAISWIVDVTTIGSVVAYAYTSACAYKVAVKSHARLYVWCGRLGIAISVLFILTYMVPSILSVSVLSTESYLILCGWSILGLLFFRRIFIHDTKQRLGHSTLPWIVMLSLILFSSFIWVRQSSEQTIGQTSDHLKERLEQLYEQHHLDEDAVKSETELVESQMSDLHKTVYTDTAVQIGLVVIALYTIFSIYTIMAKREKQMEVEKVLAEESSRAKTSFLSNMSHEIRTPMNAIIGLDNIALKDPDLNPRTRDQLEKIGSSAQHLLGLINDILDMSRIESGRMVLKQEDFLFHDFLEQINIMVGGQCQDKGLTYDCQVMGRVDDYYVGDDMKLKQVLINILGNAVKFTEEGGSVSLGVEQIGSFEGHRTLRFTISDTGIGMDEEYIPKIFEPFSQEDASAVNRYGGSGLGMAITKNIVEMMNGEITVHSEKGVGTTFVVVVTLRSSTLRTSEDDSKDDLHSLRALVVDDDEVACEHAQMVLSDLGIRADRCTKSQEALALVRNGIAVDAPYHVVITDYLMPGMNGMALTKAIREFDEGKTIIVVLTGYSVDDVTDDVMAAGADGLLSKPLFTDSLMREIRTAQKKRGHGPAGETDEASAVVPEGYQEGSLEGRRILLAEDIQINADIMMDLLDMEGIEAEHALNGQIAVDMFEQSDPGYFDAVLMDVRMPVLDGLSAASAIRALPREDAQLVPIVALTANAFDEDVQRSLQAGMNAHLSKPVEPERLYETLASLITAREQKAG